MLGRFRNVICSIKKIAFQTQIAHPVMYCLLNRIKIQTDPHIHAYLYIRKKRNLLNLVRCWPFTSETISQSFPTVAPRNTVLLLSKAVYCVWCPLRVHHDQRDHMCPHLDWSADFLQLSFIISERRSYVVRKDEDASDLSPHLSDGFLKTWCYLIWYEVQKKTGVFWFQPQWNCITVLQFIVNVCHNVDWLFAKIIILSIKYTH